MSAPSRLHVSKPLLSAVVLVCGLVLLFVWLATRETAAEREINRWLAQLQAAGEPINAQDLARQYPDPPMDEDADLLFAKAFVIASENPSPGSTPLVMSASILPTQAIDDLTFQQLLAFCTATAEITNALPKAVPPGARFAMRWSKGMTNAGAVNFVRVRCLVQFIATHALTAAESGDPERTTVMIEHGFAFVRTVNYEGLLVTHMMRHGCEGLMCTVAERALNRIQFSDAQLQRISRALRRETTNDFRNCLRAEHASAIWAFQAVRAGMPVETLFGGPPNPPWWKRVWNRLRRQRPGYRDADFLAYLQGIPARLHLSTLPPRVAMTEMDRLTRQYTENATSELGYGIMPSSMDRALGIHAETQARLESLAVALAVERARLANNNVIPAALDTLVPTYLPTLPRDLFDNQPLRFKKLSPGYVIYSIGADGVDDGGRERVNSNIKTNYDVTFAVER